MKVKLKSWFGLGIGLVALYAFMAVLHFLSPRLPGMAGEIYQSNMENDIEATALFYSESGDVRDYIDGRYLFLRQASTGVRMLKIKP